MIQLANYGGASKNILLPGLSSFLPSSPTPLARATGMSEIFTRRTQLQFYLFAFASLFRSFSRWFASPCLPRHSPRSLCLTLNNSFAAFLACFYTQKNDAEIYAVWLRKTHCFTQRSPMYVVCSTNTEETLCGLMVA